MRLYQKKMIINSEEKSFINITDEVKRLQAQGAIVNGMVQLFVRHTSCSLIVSENYDPDVLLDLEAFMSALVPESRPYRHCAEGLDDMPAHIRSVLTQTELSIPIVAGTLGLGQWQAIYLWEHRARAHQRQIIVSFFGE